jgi:hypothetical protein
MRIFQTELEDEGDEEEEDRPPVPPPRSKSKEVSAVFSETKSPTRNSPNERSVYYDAVEDRCGVEKFERLQPSNVPIHICTYAGVRLKVTFKPTYLYM